MLNFSKQICHSYSLGKFGPKDVLPINWNLAFVYIINIYMMIIIKALIFKNILIQNIKGKFCSILLQIDGITLWYADYQLDIYFFRFFFGSNF